MLTLVIRNNKAMLTDDDFRKMAMVFPEAEELPHFEKTSFRVNKKIFATLSDGIACLKFSPMEQSVFSTTDKTTIYPVPNKWGQQGWTFINLKQVRKEMLEDALKTAYCNVAPKKLSDQLNTE